MTTFVIKLENLSQETEKLYEQLSSHEDEFDNIINIDFEKITTDIKTFPLEFLNLIDEYQDEQDIYGNTMLNGLLYRYAEITYDNPSRIEKIRLLGVNPANFQRIRFFIANVPNPFTATTLNLIKNIKEINKSPSQRNLEELLLCKREAWEKDSEILSGKTSPKYFYSWEELKQFIVPKPIVNDGVISKAEIRRIQKEIEKGPYTDTEAAANNDKVQSVKQDVAAKADEEIEKSETPLEWIQRQAQQAGETAAPIVQDFLDKFSLGCLVRDALDCIKPKNITCREIFQNIPPGQFLERIKVAFPNGTDTLTQIEKVIEDSLLGTETSSLRKEVNDLEAWINEDLQLLNSGTLSEIENSRLRDAIREKTDSVNNKKEEIANILETKRVALNLEQEQMRAFAQGGNISSILSAIQGPNALTVTNAIIAAIDTIIPIENICEAITNALSFSLESPFVDFEGLPAFQIPEPTPLNDPFEGFSFEITDAFVFALTQSITIMIDGILRDLVSCDNLDKFVADIINQASEDSGTKLKIDQVSQRVSDLFATEEGILDVIDRNYDGFIDQFSSRASTTPILQRIDPEGNSVPIGLDQEGIKETFNPNGEVGIDLQQLAAAAERTALEVAKVNNISSLFQNSVLNSQNNWVIDSTGTKFEVEVGTQIFNLSDIDNFLNSLSDERIEELSNQGRFTPRALADASGNTQLQTPAVEQQPLTNNTMVSLTKEDREDIREQMVCVVRNVVSVLQPSQFLKLLSGKASDETEMMAFEIADLCDAETLKAIFPTQQLISNMFSSFGKLSGLASLEDEVQALVDSPEFKRNVEIDRCGPYENVEDFRQDLLSRVIQPDKAFQVLDFMKEQRKDRFNQLSQQLLDISKGKLINNNVNLNSSLIKAVRAVKNNQEIDREENPITSNESAEDITKRKIQELTSNSGVLTDMFSTVVDSIFLPIKAIFTEDMKSLGEGFSDLIEINEPIPRKITVETGNLLFPTAEVINPEFKRKLDANLIPIVDLDAEPGSVVFAKMVDKSVLATGSILPEFIISKLPLNNEEKEQAKFSKFLVDDVEGKNNQIGLKYRISGDESSNYTTKGLNGAPIPPIENIVNKRVVGAGASRNVTNYDFSSNITNTSLSFVIKGSLQELEDKYIQNIRVDPSLRDAMKEQFPSWEIKFGEVLQNNKRYFNASVSSKGSTITTLNGAERFFFDNYAYSSTLQIAEEINVFLNKRYSNPEKSRKQVFDDLILTELMPLIKRTGGDNRFSYTFAQDFANNSVDIYERTVSAFIGSLSSGVTRSRLLGPALVTQTGPAVTILESLDFTGCNDILGLKNIKAEFQNIYNKIPEQASTLMQRRGEESRPSRIGKASKIVITNILIKTICLDFILKALPSLDYFDFSRSLLTNDFLLNIVCEFVIFELDRLDLSNDTVYKKINLRSFVQENARDLYDISQEFEQCSQEERLQHKEQRYRYTIELKKIIKKYVTQLATECKRIAGVPETDISRDDFLKSVLDELKLVDIHDLVSIRESVVRIADAAVEGEDEKAQSAAQRAAADEAERLGGEGARAEVREEQDSNERGVPVSDREGSALDNAIRVEKNILSENGVNREIILQKFVMLPAVNRESKIVQENRSYFTDQKLNLLDSYGLVSIEKAKRVINKIYRDLNGKRFDLYICEDEPDHKDRFFTTPYELGIRLALVEKIENKQTSAYGEEILTLGDNAYPLSLDEVVRTKTGRIKEGKKAYNLYKLAEERIRMNARVPVQKFADSSNDLNFKNEFLPKLKNLLQEDTEVNLLLDYSIPLKQISSLFVTHYSLSNNSKKMKYLLEPTKKKIYSIAEYIQNTGNSTLTSERLQEMLQNQEKEKQNIGNPSGPLNMEALKIFYRTPIQILKAVAIVTDPNIAITDKVVSALTIAQKTLPLPEEVKSIPIPYSLTSLSLLPAPIFGGLIPYIPPLTSYNVASPIGPIFLGLEPLLWDLPFYSNTNKEKASDDETCDD